MLRCIRGHEEGQGDGDETTPIHSAVQSHVAPRGSLLVRTTIHGPGGIPACFWNKCRQSARFALFANAGVTPQALDRVSRMSSDMLAHRRDIVGFLQWAGEFVVLNAHDEEWCEDFDMDCFDSRLSDSLCRGVRFYPPRGFYDFFIACPKTFSMDASMRSATRSDRRRSDPVNLRRMETPGDCFIPRRMLPPSSPWPQRAFPSPACSSRLSPCR